MRGGTAEEEEEEEEWMGKNIKQGNQPFGTTLVSIPRLLWNLTESKLGRPKGQTY